MLSARILFRRLRVFSMKSATMAISVCWPCAPPDGWWMRTMEFGRHSRLPFAPSDSSTAAMEAHSPRQMVDTSHLMKSIVSRMASPAVTDAARRVDVERDVLVGIGALKMEHLRNHRVRHVVIDLLAQEDDAIVEQAGVDVVAALAARRLLDNVGNQRRLGIEAHKVASLVRGRSAACLRLCHSEVFAAHARPGYRFVASSCRRRAVCASGLLVAARRRHSASAALASTSSAFLRLLRSGLLGVGFFAGRRPAASSFLAVFLAEPSWPAFFSSSFFGGRSSSVHDRPYP